MNHKRGKPKNARSGCLLCKPHKANGAKGKLVNKTMQERKAAEDEKTQLNNISEHGDCDCIECLP